MVWRLIETFVKSATSCEGKSFQKNLIQRFARNTRSTKNMKQIVVATALAVIIANLAPEQTARAAEVTIDGVAGFQDSPLEPDGKWHIHDPARPQPVVVAPAKTFSLNAPAPSDAEALFDGNGLTQWQTMQGAAAVTWKTNEDYMETINRGGNIRTRKTWADFQMHVEWATPNPAKGDGQGRGNGGIIINNMYEVQVLDSYQAKTYADGQAGALYGQSPPLVNASKPPGEWQSYDILFESPRWNDKGELIKKAVITVLHNGMVIQNHYELLGATDGINGAVPWRSSSKYTAPHAPEVFIGLQGDHSPGLRYRNIWIRPLHLNQQP